MLIANGTTLPADAEALLDHLWTTLLGRTKRAIPRRQIRTIARQVSASAHRVMLRPEDLILAVKTSWSRHDGFRVHDERHRVQWALTEVISSCITEYYDMERGRHQGESVTGA